MSAGWVWVAAMLTLLASPGAAQTQTYSVPVEPEYNSIAMHLANDLNQLDKVIPNPPEGSMLFKWNPAIQDYYSPASFSQGRWTFQQPEMQFLRVGEGALLLVNRSSNLTFSGSPTGFVLPRQAVFGGFNFVSSHQPRPMSFGELFGFAPAAGDRVFMFDSPVTFLPRAAQIEQAASSVHRFTAQGWDFAPIFKTGKSAFVHLRGLPRILSHPQSIGTNAGDNLRLEVSALGAEPLQYQWHLNEDELPGETKSALLLPNVQFWQAGFYAVSVRNSFGEVMSRPATVHVRSAPVILEPPQPVQTTPGQRVLFHVKAVGTPTLRYAWYRNNLLIRDETEPHLEVIADQTAEYHVAVMNSLGTNNSRPVTLEVNEPPTITRQPLSQVVRMGEKVEFTVEAQGTSPFRYQWRRNGRNILGETNKLFIIPDAQPIHSGDYQVIVANVAGVAHSDIAELIVDVPSIFLADRREDSEIYNMSVFTGRGHNLDARNEPEEIHCGRPGGSSVWLRWVAKERGIVRFDTSGSSFDTVLAAYISDAAGRLMEVACDDDEGEFLGSRIRFTALPDTIYYIAVDGLDGARGQILLDWELIPTPELLPIVTQHPIDQTGRSGQPVTFFVAADVGEPGAQLEYQWFLNSEPILQGGNEPALRVVVSKETLGYYHAEVRYDREIARSRRALLQISLADSDERLLHAFAADKFADAFNRLSQGGLRTVAATAFTPVMGYTGTQIFSTVGFGGEPGELSHCGIPGGSSAWFAFIPAADGQLYLNTSGSSFNTVLAVYTGPGPTLASLTSLACDNDSGPGTSSSLSFPAKAGTTYYIAVDGLNGVTGTAHLNYRLLIPITLTRTTKTNDTLCTFRVTATPSYPFTIQRCVGLSSWSSVLTTNRPTGVYDYRDTNAIVEKRFYRVLQTP